ncbi:MAG TPA: zf-HC2 domain-containing protein [Vicinamibacterales bacterium]
MTQKFECGDNAALVGYLYDECEPSERRAIEAHLARCAACAAEVGALSSTRLQLAAWTPPESDLGFRIVSESRSNVIRPKQWWHRPLPAWAQAAAAVLIFGVGLSLGIIGGGERDVTQSAEVVPASVPDAGARLIGSQLTPAVSRDDLAALEQRVRAEMSQMRPVTPAVAGSEAQLLARVRALIDESEQRQRRELALRTAELMRDVDAQRQYDFARVQRALGQFEGQTGLEFQRQRQDLNNLIRVSQRPQ